MTVDAEQGAALLAIAKRYARLLPSGRPVRCMPSRAERTGEVPRAARVGNDGKIIYNTEDKAEWAAREMYSVTDVRQRPYRCKRGRGHFHLETERG